MVGSPNYGCYGAGRFILSEVNSSAHETFRPAIPGPNQSGEERRLAFLITGLGYGGAETQLLRLATEMRNRGWEVLVVSMLSPTGLAMNFERAGIPLASLHMVRGIADPRGPLRLLALLRRFRPHVLHSHMVHANLLARVIRLVHRVPVLISTAHSINEGGRWRALAIRTTDSLCDLTTSVSLAAVDRYRRERLAPEHKLLRMPNGVDMERFRGDPKGRTRVRRALDIERSFVWLAVGRFTAAKDHPTLFRAFSRLARRHPDAVLLVAGEGPLRNNYLEILRQLNLLERVHFLGFRSDVADLMNAADAYVMSSAWEGLPMVLLEAASAGLPIIATDVGGNGEIVQQGSTGYLAPPHDPGALAAAMERLLETPASHRQRLGREARRQVARKYGLDRVAGQWENLYRALLERAQQQR